MTSIHIMKHKTKKNLKPEHFSRNYIKFPPQYQTIFKRVCFEGCKFE